MITPVRTPDSDSLPTASTRLIGWGVPGSVRRHTSRSRVPMEKLTVTSEG
jgi:hypothetical protein